MRSTSRSLERQSGTRKQEQLYLGGFDVFREYAGDGTTVTLERETLHVAVGQPIALVETRTGGTDPGPPQLIRYQFSNHLGSATLELDISAQVISYEEYYPYGSTSYQAVRSQTETPKRYRYTGMERDEETGFAYHGARYYSSWLGRWISAEPAWLVDGANLYRYARNNPTCFIDPSGRDTEFPAEVHGRRYITDEEIYKEYKAGEERIDKQIIGEREISKKRFINRFKTAQFRATPDLAELSKGRTTAQDVWNYGISHDLFTEQEKGAVFKEMNEWRAYQEAERRAASERIKRKALIDQEQKIIDDMESIKSNVNLSFIQGALVGGAGVFGSGVKLTYNAFQRVWISS